MAKQPGKKPDPLIALLTDFGTHDWFVASMKAVIKNIAPQAELIDLTHEVIRQNVMAASFILESCYRDFPPGTIFCCVVDPGVGTRRRRLAATNGLYFFIAPDNGLLTGVERQSQTFLAHVIENTAYMHIGSGTTFEGRDVFAPAAAYLASGIPLQSFGPTCEDIIRLPGIFPQREKENRIICKVAYIDHFGNLVTNIGPELLPETANLREVNVTINKRTIVGMVEGYESVKKGLLLAYWGSTGKMEIALSHGSAARSLDATIGTPVILEITNPSG